MLNRYQYPGEELQLFEQAKNWKKYFSSRLKPFIRGRVLEAGAGMGETTAFLLTKEVADWTCLEPDEKLINLLQLKIKTGRLPPFCRPRKGTIDDLAPTERFDTMVYIDVLEHIEDDRNEMTKAVSKLNSNGHLIVLAPALQALYSPFDQTIGHCRRYTKHSLRKTMEHPELVEVKTFYLETSGVLILWLNKLLFRKKYPSPGDIKIWDRFFVPLSMVIDRLLFYSTGKTVISIWKKPPAS